MNSKTILKEISQRETFTFTNENFFNEDVKFQFQMQLSEASLLVLLELHEVDEK